MAFEADCGASTVLEELCVARTFGFLVPAKNWLPSRRGPPQQRRADSWTPNGRTVACRGSWPPPSDEACSPRGCQRPTPTATLQAGQPQAVPRAGKFEIRNSKFEIRNL